MRNVTIVNILIIHYITWHAFSLLVLDHYELDSLVMKLTYIHVDFDEFNQFGEQFV